MSDFSYKGFEIPDSAVDTPKGIEAFVRGVEAVLSGDWKPLDDGKTEAYKLRNGVELHANGHYTLFFEVAPNRFLYADGTRKGAEKRYTSRPYSVWRIEEGEDQYRFFAN